jgi:hypothetical protein
LLGYSVLHIGGYSTQRYTLPDARSAEGGRDRYIKEAEGCKASDVNQGLTDKMGRRRISERVDGLIGLDYQEWNDLAGEAARTIRVFISDPSGVVVGTGLVCKS